MDGSHGVTYSHQDELPKLPIPDLKDTTEKYLTALRPLQSQHEQHDTVKTQEVCNWQDKLHRAILYVIITSSFSFFFQIQVAEILY